ncbi:MAG: HAD family hydrolase [Chloroflexota bacterium]
MALQTRAVLFDAGNTLIHMPRRPEEILRELCGHLGVSIGLEEAHEACRRSEQYYVRHYLGYAGDQGEFWHRYHGEALRCLGVGDPTGEKAAYLSHGFGWVGVWQPYPEAAEVCRGLLGMGLRLGVVSNGSITVSDLLSQAGLLPFFEFVIASQSLGIQKPDPRVFATALERMGLDPQEALYVGDLYEVDVLGARGAGLAAVLIDRRGGGAGLDCPVIRSLEELIPLVEN